MAQKDRTGQMIRFRPGGNREVLSGKVREGVAPVGMSLGVGLVRGAKVWHVPEASDGRYWQVPDSWIVN